MQIIIARQFTAGLCSYIKLTSNSRSTANFAEYRRRCGIAAAIATYKDMDRLLFELLLADALAKAAASQETAQEPEEHHPDNFFVLTSSNDRVWQGMFRRCKEDYMVVGVEFTDSSRSQKVIRAAILDLARKLYGRPVIFLRAPIVQPFSTHDQVRI